MEIAAAPLPIDDAIPGLRAALVAAACAVLVAPPGAGKTTRVPLALIDEAWLGGCRILMLEPRRLAARAAATRLAATLGEKPGATVGLRARMMTEVSPATRIEVVTEGVFTRMILDDPELAGVGLVIFDEFHERSLDADFGLALARDTQQGLREDLRILVMSATLDGARVAALLGGCPVVASEGRSFPVETHYLGRNAARPLETQIASAVLRALRETAGSILVFLPGQAEIRRAERALGERLAAADAAGVRVLHGGLDRRQQDAAIAPPGPGSGPGSGPGERRIILATAIAETSLTLDGISAVIDSGLARQPRYDIGARLTRLATTRVSRASADQRRGRAGRLGPGHCYRLWAEPETTSLSPYATPEILSSDLSGLLLDCAAWGVTDPAMLSWLDPPPAAGLDAARADLMVLGALDEERRLTEFGEIVRRLPLPPVLAAMICRARAYGAESAAAMIAALLVEHGLGGTAADLDERLQRFRSDRSERGSAMRRMAGRWSAAVRGAMPSPKAPIRQLSTASLSTGAILALGYPDRIARPRTSGTGRAPGGPAAGPTQVLMAGGSAALLGEEETALARAPFLVIADVQGGARAGRITAAAALSEDELTIVAGGRITQQLERTFDRDSLQVRGRRRRRLGAIVLASEPVALSETGAETGAASGETAALLADGIAEVGLDVLPWTKAQRQMRARVGFLRRTDPGGWPDLSDQALPGDRETWLTPILAGKTAVREITADDLATGLGLLLDYPQRQRLEREAPTHFEAPTGNRHPIDYDGEHAPSVALRVQELFGLKAHPAIAAGRLALTLVLLSPAGRPIQVTRDLPGFWAGSWADVRSDLRGRYPKHPWPEDPANAEPTTRAKRTS